MSTSSSARSPSASGALGSSSPSLHDFENSETVTPMEMSVDETLPGVGSSPDLARDGESGQRDTNRTDTMLGQTLGSYKLLRILGEGGMGRVYLAEHTKIGRQVALKMLHTHLARSPDVVRRFFDEARAVNQILHENIVEITDFIENEDGNNYFIMEYLRGMPLSSVLDNPKGNLSLGRALDIGIQVTSALGAVHKASIVHRDLKPENIFLTERGGQKDFVKLLDFGIAKLVGDLDSGIKLKATEAGVIMGTPDYMSPQQASATPVDHRTDIYSLGVILYEMCTGRLPFKAKDFGDLIVMHRTKSPLVPHQVPNLLQPIPGPLSEFILACLEKEPENRPQTCAAIEERLRGIREEFAEELDHFDLALSSSRSGGSRSRLLPVVAGVAGIAGAGALLFTLLGSGDRASASHPPAPVVAPRAEVAPVAVPETAEAPLPSQVQLSFRSEPAGAQVYALGASEELLGVTPFDISLDHRDEEADFEWRKEGFQPLAQQIRLDRSNRIQVSLQPVASESAAAEVSSKRDRKRDRAARQADSKQAAKSSDEQATEPSPEKKKTMYKEGAVMNPFGSK